MVEFEDIQNIIYNAYLRKRSIHDIRDGISKMILIWIGAYITGYYNKNIITPILSVLAVGITIGIYRIVTRQKENTRDSIGNQPEYLKFEQEYLDIMYIKEEISKEYYDNYCLDYTSVYNKKALKALKLYRILRNIIGFFLLFPVYKLSNLAGIAVFICSKGISRSIVNSIWNN